MGDNIDWSKAPAGDSAAGGKTFKVDQSLLGGSSSLLSSVDASRFTPIMKMRSTRNCITCLLTSIFAALMVHVVGVIPGLSVEFKKLILSLRICADQVCAVSRR